MPNEKLVRASAVRDLLMGLDELPWEENVDNLVDSLPTVDVVEVVRCKDCKKYSPFNCVNYGICGLHGSSTDGNAYCSEGERKANAT